MIATDALAILVISEPWVRLSPNSRSAEAYVQLRSTEGATLVAVRSDATAKIDIRRGATSRDSIEEIKLPPGETVLLAPGADRFVLLGLYHPLKLGDYVGIVLTFMSADGDVREIPLNAEVRLRSPTDDHLRGHRH